MSQKLTVHLLAPENEELRKYAQETGLALNTVMRYAVCLLVGLPVPSRIADDALKNMNVDITVAP